MKSLGVFVSLIFLLTPMQKQVGGPKFEYDKFRDKTTVTQSIETINIRGAKGVKLSAYYGFDGKLPVAISGHGIIVAVIRNTTNDDSDEELRLLIDGKLEGPYTGTLTDSGRYAEGFTQFYLFAEISIDVIKRIANAGKVEGLIGKVEFELSSSAIRQINTFYRGMPNTGNLKIKYDRDEDTTTVDTGMLGAINVKGAERVDFYIGYEYSGKMQPSKVREDFMVGFPYAGQRLELDLRLLIDGHPQGPYLVNGLENEQLKSDEHKVYSARHNAREINDIIARAHTVSGEIGNIKFDLSPEAISRVNELYERMTKK